GSRVYFCRAPAPGRGLPGSRSLAGGPVAPRPPAEGGAPGRVGPRLPRPGPRPEGPPRPGRRRLGPESQAGCPGAALAPPLCGRVCRPGAVGNGPVVSGPPDRRPAVGRAGPHQPGASPCAVEALASGGPGPWRGPRGGTRCPPALADPGAPVRPAGTVGPGGGRLCTSPGTHTRGPQPVRRAQPGLPGTGTLGQGPGPGGPTAARRLSVAHRH